MDNKCCSCGHVIDDKVAFCPYCGSDVKKNDNYDDIESVEPLQNKRRRTLTFNEFNKSGGEYVEILDDVQVPASVGSVPENAINKRKRNLTLIIAGIALAMIVMLLAILVFRKSDKGYRVACDQQTNDGWVYDIYSDNTAVVKGYNGSLTKLEIPSNISQYSVTAIEKGQGWGSPISVSLPNSVKSIGAYAFEGCYSVKSVEIPGGVRRVGEYAFEGTQWLESVRNSGNDFIIIGDGVLLAYCGDAKTVELPSKVKSISTAFTGNTAVTSVVINNETTVIEAFAFAGAESLVHIEIPESVAEIGMSAFLGTPWIEGITDEFVMVGDGVLIDYNGANQTVNVPNSVKYISDAFSGNKNIIAVSTPGSVRVIGQNAFWNCNSLQRVTLNNGVVEIRDCAFKATGLVAVKLPNSVKFLGKQAFAGCSKLASVTLSTGLPSLYEDTFYICSSLENVIIPKGVKYIEDGAFAYCYKLNGVTLSKEIQFIHKDAFKSSENIVIYAPAGSYGSDFAEKNEYALVTR